MNNKIFENDLIYNILKMSFFAILIGVVFSIALVLLEEKDVVSQTVDVELIDALKVRKKKKILVPMGDEALLISGWKEQIAFYELVLETDETYSLAQQRISEIRSNVERQATNLFGIAVKIKNRELRVKVMEKIIKNTLPDMKVHTKAKNSILEEG